MASDAVALKARRLFASAQQGLLSTLSVDGGCYPVACVVAYARDRAGRALFLVGRGAEPARNLMADNRVSLTVTEDGGDGPASQGLTVVGRAVPVALAEQDDAARRLYRRFPQAAACHRTRDFELYCLEPARARYSAGFGAECWIGAGALCEANPFPPSVEEDMLTCMNCSHVDAMRGYCRLFAVEPGEQDPRLAAIDHEGFDLMVGRHLLRIDFEQPVCTTEGVRRALVELALHAQQTGLAA